uniref:G-protein coupled receptors family 1 profile domain-containing protein n=1 Tax=Ascaris lumbricoides TaxID=6252 RepID=A0A9J2P2B1_ASCLU
MASINFLTGFTVGVSGFTVVFNLTLAGTIFFSKNARVAREYVLVVSTLIMDTIFNLAYLFSSIVRIATQERPSRLSCDIQAFPCFFFVIGTPLVGFSIVLVALDRFYAVIYPASYYKSDAKQAWIGVAGSLGTAVIVLLVFIAVMSTQPIKCVLGFEGVSAIMPFLLYLRIASIGLAVFIYGAIYAYVKANQERVAERLGQQHAMNRMMAIFKTAVIAMLPAVLLIFIPDICLSFGFLVEYKDWLNAMIMFKGAINIFIYTLRHRDLRRCVFALFVCKLPQNASHNKVTVIITRSPITSTNAKDPSRS